MLFWEACSSVHTLQSFDFDENRVVYILYILKVSRVSDRYGSALHLNPGHFLRSYCEMSSFLCGSSRTSNHFLTLVLIFYIQLYIYPHIVLSFYRS